MVTRKSKERKLKAKITQGLETSNLSRVNKQTRSETKKYHFLETSTETRPKVLLRNHLVIKLKPRNTLLENRFKSCILKTRYEFPHNGTKKKTN